MRPPKLYLAGPDVFLRDAVAAGRRKKDLCRAHGMVGLYPLDNEIVGDRTAIAPRIYAANVAMMREADGAIVNLTPFRGPSADPGTVFELGMLVAMGKHVFAYSNSAETLLERTRRSVNLSVEADGRDWRDADDMSVEDFGYGDNLMIDAAVLALGRRIHRAEVTASERFSDLSGFVACLTEAKLVFA